MNILYLRDYNNLCELTKDKLTKYSENFTGIVVDCSSTKPYIQIKYTKNNKLHRTNGPAFLEIVSKTRRANAAKYPVKTPRIPLFDSEVWCEYFVNGLYKSITLRKNKTISSAKKGDIVLYDRTKYLILDRKDFSQNMVFFKFLSPDGSVLDEFVRTKGCTEYKLSYSEKEIASIGFNETIYNCSVGTLKEPTPKLLDFSSILFG